jgi:nucleoside-diphosphate-sugar epimerase
MNRMRVLVLGGTGFIGRRIVADLVARGDRALLVHRGDTEPDGLADSAHLHADRREFAAVADRVRSFAPDGVIDTLAMCRADVDGVLPHLPDVPIVMLSSMDVYRAFGLVLAGGEGEPVPLDETSPVRDNRYPYADSGVRPSHYDKLDVEPSYLERGAAVLRLSMIYGEHDPQRREEFILRRVRAGRRRIPIGPGTFLWTRCYVGDVSSAVLAALGNPAAAGEIFDIGEPTARSVRGWATQILAAAGHDAELVTTPEDALPEDMRLTRSIAQHVLVRCEKATRVLGWRPGDPAERVGRSVRWHLAHPPPDAPTDFDADERALATADRSD